MGAWDELTRLATTGDYAGAVRWIDTHDARPAFDGLFALAVNQPKAFDGLWNSVPYGGGKLSDFALDLIYDGAMPQREYAEVGWFDYDEAREVYLRAWEGKKRPVTWPKSRHDNASSVCLYPEYVRRQSRRTAVINLANDHEELGPNNRYQANLWCLGGRYTFSIGKQGTTPSGPTGKGTTCMLFARSILHAAGINVIGPRTKTWCGCDDGLKAEIAHLGCYVNTKDGTSPPTPKAGDIYHVKGPNYSGNVSSEHVGIIVSVNGNQWTCIQGGDPTHVTKRKFLKVVPRTGDKDNGLFRLEGDALVNGVSRGIIGYWNLDSIVKDFFMARPG